jgi:hypothetical protein
MSDWKKIDYENSETWPIPSMPCMLGWHPNPWQESPMTADVTYMRVGDDDNGWDWAECHSGDYADFSDDLPPTHWCYAPQLHNLPESWFREG